MYNKYLEILYFKIESVRIDQENRAKALVLINMKNVPKTFQLASLKKYFLQNIYNWYDPNPTKNKGIKTDIK